MDGTCGYYSTKEQLAELLECLDPNLYETDLVQNLGDKREEIEDHMDITLRLTIANKPENVQSYLELENEAIVKVQEERRELKEREKLERKKAQAEVDKMIREEDESRKMKGVKGCNDRTWRDILKIICFNDAEITQLFLYSVQGCQFSLHPFCNRIPEVWREEYFLHLKRFFQC